MKGLFFMFILKNSFGKALSSKLYIPVEKYRAVLLNVEVHELPNNSSKMTFYYTLINHRTGKHFEFKETIVNNLNLIRCREFFSYLESAHVEFDTLDDLIGIVFDGWLDYECVGGKAHPILNDKKIVAHPPKFED